jgi:dUTP pyrophosphatase
MRLQIVGPMTGLPEDNVPAFMEAEERLSAAGHEVVNPVLFASPEQRRLAVSLGNSFRDTADYRELVWRCLESIRKQDGIATLEGWQRSTGASAEVHMARAMSIPIEPVHWWEADPQDVLLWTGDPECEPVKAYADDAGFDLYVAEDTRIPIDGFKDVPLGISVELPKGKWGMLTGRSSTVWKRRILVVQGIIDNGYRGPLFAGCQNVGQHACELERGERIAQLILFSVETPVLRYASKLSESDRGEAAFGSSGR